MRRYLARRRIARLRFALDAPTGIERPKEELMADLKKEYGRLYDLMYPGWR